jgi:hypothetical protein
MYSVHDHRYEYTMLEAWQSYVNLSSNPDRAIVNLVNQKFNPYRSSIII